MDQEPIETVEYQVPTTVLPNANKIIELTAVNELSEVVATIAETGAWHGQAKSIIRQFQREKVGIAFMKFIS